MLDVFVETESAMRRRDVPHIVPIGNVDVVLGQHGTHGAAQKSREMTGKRGDQKDPRLGKVAVLAEVQQRPKRGREHGTLAHGHLAVADRHAIDAKCRAVMGQSGSGNELVCGCEIAHDAISGNSGRAGADRLESPACPGANRTHHVGLDLIRVVEHSPLAGRHWATRTVLQMQKLVHFVLQREIISTARGDRRGIEGISAWPRSPLPARITAPGRCAVGCFAKWPVSQFDEEQAKSDDPSTRAELLLLSPSFLVPCLTHDGVKVWDTLAIAEYLNEGNPDAKLLPAERGPRARCRAVCGEMHSGFSNLRSALPINLKAHYPGFKVWAGAQADIERITTIWRECLATSTGPYLFGAQPCMADAMYAPVVTRFLTYDVKLDSRAAAYCEAVMALPHMKEWITAAKTEPDDLEELDVEF